MGEMTIACRCDEDNIFQAHPPQSKIVKSGLHCYDVTGCQRGLTERDSRRLVNIQAEPVPGSMEKALHPSVDFTGREAPLLEEREDLLMNLFCVDPVPDHSIGDFLSCLHGDVGFLEPLRSSPPHHGTAQVYEIAGLL